MKSSHFDDIIAAEGARAYTHDGSGSGALLDAAAAATGGGGGSVLHLRGGGAGGSMSGNLGGSMQTSSMHPGPSYGAHDGGNSSGSYGTHKGDGGNSSGPPSYRRDGHVPHHSPAPGQQHQPDGYLPQHAPQYVHHCGDNSLSPAYSSGHKMALPVFEQHQFSGGSYGRQIPDQFGRAGRAGLAQSWTDVLPPPLPLQNQPPGSQHPYLQQQMLQQQLVQQLSGMHDSQLPQQLQPQQPAVSQQQQQQQLVQQLVQQLETMQTGQQQHQQQSPLQPQSQAPS